VTDPCGNGPSLQEGVNLAGQDICSVTVDTVRATEDDPTSGSCAASGWRATARRCYEIG
jgi:hypothetical protein